MVAERPRVKKWTLDEVDRLLASGALENPQRWELLDGDLVEKMPQNVPHWYGVRFSMRALQRIFGIEQPMVSQGPLKLSKIDAPEPDVAFFTRETPYLKGEEILIVVEVGDTSIDDDLRRKARIYARHGIGDYWVLDLPRQRLIVHRRPHRDTEDWGQVFEVLPGELVAPLAARDHPIEVTELLRQGDA